MMTDVERRLLRILTATSEQLVAIDRVLDGRAVPETPAPAAPKGPALMMIKDAAAFLGVHRATIWRLMKAGRLGAVELLGAVRVRRADVEAIVAGRSPSKE